MSNDFQDADIFGQLKSAVQRNSGKPAASAAAPASQVFAFGEGLEKTVQDAVKREQVMEDVVNKYFIREKLIRTPDFATWRAASLYDEIAVRRNANTPFLNFIESNGAPVPMSDTQIEFKEWNIGQDEAEVWDVEGDTFPGAVASKRNKRSNTLTCIGNIIETTLFVEEMMQQQGGIDVMAREVNMELDRIRWKMNKLLITNTENKIQSGPMQLGGFIDRSVDYGLDLGSDDLTRPDLQGRINAIANNADIEGFGFNLPLVAFTSSNRQCEVLRDILISEYGGIFPTDRVSMESYLAGRAQGYKINAVVYFEPINSPVIPFILESQLPTGTTIIFDPADPRLAKMRMMGTYGPWLLQRPVEALKTKNVMFDLFSLVDPYVDKRSVISHA